MLTKESLRIFQSTLPRRERQIDRLRIFCCGIISIHAPAKGATHTSDLCRFIFPISIHAPAKGATTASVELSDNSIISIHAPAKGATMIGDVLTDYTGISIHAPAKGATLPVL